MSALVYKPGQGYWTRLMSAIGGGMLIAFAALYVSGKLETIDVDFERIYLQGGVVAAIILFGGVILYWLCYVKRSTGEFLIATEGEMKKVNWSTRREIIGSTWVVIMISVVIAAILLVTDLLFSFIFQRVGVLESV
ncbi:MAG: preprotein translocase subunit SecE [Planctomycetota bacterium]